MNSGMNASDRARAVVDALLEGEVDESEARNAVKALGIDVSALAMRLKAQVDDQDRLDRAARFAQLEAERQTDLLRLRTTDLVEGASRQRMLGMMTSLIQKAGSSASVHYMKFEEATDEELAEMIRSLKHLVSDGDR